MSNFDYPYDGTYVLAPPPAGMQPGMQPGMQAMPPAAAVPAQPYAGGAYSYYPPAGYAPAGIPAGITGAALAARAAPAQPALGLGSDRFVRGLFIGAAAAYLLTNEEVQRTVIKGAVKVWSSVQGGLEEAKERFRDAEAEIQAAAADKES
jgi:hypothetical protein